MDSSPSTTTMDRPPERDRVSRSDLDASAIPDGTGNEPDPAAPPPVANDLAGGASAPGGPSSAAPWPTTAAPWPTTAVAAVASAPSGSRLFDQVAAPRWTALAAAAAIAVAALGLTAARPGPDVPISRIATAVGTTIDRAGSVGPAVAGSRLLPGDTIAVADGGTATLVFDHSEARLGGGAIVRVSRLEADAIRLVQVVGRVYHRVDIASGGAYVVQTASVEWTARGTAFDLDREPIPGGTGEQVTLITIQHAVALHGPEVDGTIGEGRRAVVLLGGEVPDVSTAAVPDAVLADPWLVANGGADLAQGRPLGILGATSR